MGCLRGRSLLELQENRSEIQLILSFVPDKAGDQNLVGAFPSKQNFPTTWDF
jgi:hypothetical protein